MVAGDGDRGGAARGGGSADDAVAVGHAVGQSRDAGDCAVDGGDGDVADALAGADGDAVLGEAYGRVWVDVYGQS